MNINIYGSTGQIGRKTLKLIKSKFPKIKVNLLCANSNVNLLLKQINSFKPNYVYLNNPLSSEKLKLQIRSKTKVLSYEDLNFYLKNSKSDFSILAISGYKSLYFLDQIVRNTNNLGIVSKEAIVSAGHIFTKKKYFTKTKIFPLDSEHYSLYEYFNSQISKKNIKNITITASGGPFYKKKFSSLKNITFNQAIKHPKWKMGYKNSIDSATLVNKCLEIIEVHYLFNIPFDKIKIIIHPEALVHSIIEKDNYVTNLNLFKNDMNIPINNFLMLSNTHTLSKLAELSLSNFGELKFNEVNYDNFPIYKYFNNMDLYDPSLLIRFNVGNEYAVNLFKNKLIKYTEILKIIKKVCSLDLKYRLNTIKDIIKYHEDLEKLIKIKFNYNT